MTWLAWRQFRAQALSGAIGIALLGAVLLATGPGLADDYADGLALCGSGCREFIDVFIDQHQAALLATTAIVLLLPALLGLFWGAPLVARELDAGTHRLVWNQSVTRARWLGVKLRPGRRRRRCRRRVGRLGGRPVVHADRRRRRCRNHGSRSRSPSRPAASYPSPTRCSRSCSGSPSACWCAARCPRWRSRWRPSRSCSSSCRPWYGRTWRPVVTETVVISPTNLEGLSQAPGGMQVMATSPEPGGWLLSSHTVDAAGRKVDAIPMTPDDPACAAGRASIPAWPRSSGWATGRSPPTTRRASSGGSSGPKRPGTSA